MEAGAVVGRSNAFGALGGARKGGSEEGELVGAVAGEVPGAEATAGTLVRGAFGENDGLETGASRGGDATAVGAETGATTGLA